MATGVDQLDEAIGVLLSADLSRLDGPEVVELARRMERGRRRLAAVDHRVLAEMESRRLAGDYARATTVDLLVSELRITPAEAKARFLHAQDLGPRSSLIGEQLPSLLPRCTDATIDGSISPGHVQVIRNAVDAVPAEFDPAVVDLVEATLVSAARFEHPGHLSRTATLLLDRINPDGIEPREHDVARKRSISLSCGRDGTGRLRGTLTAEATAAWHAILDSLAAPAPCEDGEPDMRTAGQRTHDALLEAGMRLLRSGDLPPVGGVPVTILVRTTAADLAAATAPLHDTAGPADGTGTTDIGNGHAVRDGIGITTRGAVLSLRNLLTSGEADIHPVLFGERGDVLRLGRTARLATRAQRLALTARDGGCCFPGCDKPASWTEVHHIREWQDFGPTDIDNLCLVCRFHHRQFERRGWAVRMTDGLPEWVPPPWIDPAQAPRRNTAHHPPEPDVGALTVPRSAPTSERATYAMVPN